MQKINPEVLPSVKISPAGVPQTLAHRRLGPLQHRLSVGTGLRIPVRLRQEPRRAKPPPRPALFHPPIEINDVRKP
jgi:hypothetical protein